MDLEEDFTENHLRQLNGLEILILSMFLQIGKNSLLEVNVISSNFIVSLSWKIFTRYDGLLEKHIIRYSSWYILNKWYIDTTFD